MLIIFAEIPLVSFSTSLLSTISNGVGIELTHLGNRLKLLFNICAGLMFLVIKLNLLIKFLNRAITQIHANITEYKICLNKVM